MVKKKGLISLSRQPKSTLTSSWVSASATYNYMMKDPLLDWLNHHYSTVDHLRRLAPPDSADLAFTPFIMAKGQQFESKIIQHLQEKFGPTRVIELHGEENPRAAQKAQATFLAMKKGVPFIHSGVLHNSTNQTFGIPDLLVRSDWLKHLVSHAPLTEAEEQMAAVKLNKQATWHYTVVDIKFTTLLLRADGQHLLNAMSLPAYKVQLAIYNQALGHLQGYTPAQAYLLGRNSKFISKGIPYYLPGFDRLGVVNYQTKDAEYLGQMEAAIAWVRQVSQPAAKYWNINQYPLSRWELYPNMSNHHDYPWHQLKSQLARKNHELTSLWMVGPKNRQLALNQGVCHWSDPACTANALGLNSEFKSGMLNAILAINRSPTETIAPKIIKNNFGFWQQPPALEFYVDFETVNEAVLQDSRRQAEISNLIFMIGVGYRCPNTQRWIYRDFTVNRLTLAEEREICLAFAKYLEKLNQSYGLTTPRCVHWGHAEHTLWMQAVQRHDELLRNWRAQIDWLDLLSVFKAEPIVIKGCLSFGLKEVATAMYQQGLIETTWDQTSLCADGLSAMVLAQQANQRQGSFKRQAAILEVIKYNEVDVRVLAEILSYLRENHLAPAPKKRKQADTTNAANTTSRRIKARTNSFTIKWLK